jgi:hypothetical protein
VSRIPVTRFERSKQEIPSIHLSLERSTKDVPDDGRFHVLVSGEIRYSSGSQKKALDFYAMERDMLFASHGRPEPAHINPEDRERWIQEQRLEFDLRAMNQELASTVVANARRKGGKGK